MNTHDEERMKKLLRQSLPPVKSDAGPERDLWPALLRKLDAPATARAMPGWACFNSAWFDGALLAGLVGLAAFFPATIPLFLYYL
jgi:hypothetical protein